MAEKKRLTQKEKKINARIKKEYQEKGILPPDKPRLDRKKFIQEAEREWNERDENCLVWDIFIMRAIGCMMAHKERRRYTPSLEAVGAAKVLKIALRLQAFSKELQEKGQKEYKISEQYDYIKNVLDA